MGTKTIKLGSFVVLPLMRNPLLIFIYFTGWSWSDYQFADIYLQYAAGRLDFWTAPSYYLHLTCNLFTTKLNKVKDRPQTERCNWTNNIWIKTYWNQPLMTVDKLYTRLTANTITTDQSVLTDQSYVTINWQILSTWPWRWLALRMSKHQSPSTN